MSSEKQFSLMAKVDHSFKHPLGYFTVYRMVIQQKTEVGVEEKTLFKRFREFQKLRRSLVYVHKAFGLSAYPMPCLPSCAYFNRFQPEIVEARRVALDALVKFICSHEHLFCHTQFTKFIVETFSSCRRSAIADKRDSLLPPVFPNMPVMKNVSNENCGTSNIKCSFLDHKTMFTNQIPFLSHFEYLKTPLCSDDETEAEEDNLDSLWASLDLAKNECSKKGLHCMAKAKQLSRSGLWLEAFKAYKEAVSILSSSLKGEKKADEECRQTIASCLLGAEHIHRLHIMRTNSISPPVDFNGLQQPAWMEPPKLSTICQDAALIPLFMSSERLHQFRVCRIEASTMVVCDDLGDGQEYNLESMPAPGFKSIAAYPQIYSANLKKASFDDYILPLNDVPFMTRLRGIVETDYQRVFLLTERPKGGLLVDWFHAFLDSRIVSEASLKRRNSEVTVQRLLWCKKRSSRIRMLLASFNCVEETSSGYNEFSIGDQQLRTSTSISDSFSSSTTISENSSIFSDLLASDDINKSSADRFFSSTPRIHSLRLPSQTVFFNAYVSSYSVCDAESHAHSDNEGCVLKKVISLRSRNISVKLSESDEQDIHLKPPNQGSSLILFPNRRIRQWAAELVTIVSGLHDRGIIIRNLSRSDVYLGSKGHIQLRYFCNWPSTSIQGRHDFSLAPELRTGTRSLLTIASANPNPRIFRSCDWWSVGVILYELCTGVPLQEVYVSGFIKDEPLDLPPDMDSSPIARLLISLIVLDPYKRLSVEEIKSHDFFKAVDWNDLSTGTQR